MVVDSSAILAVLFDEPEATAVEDAIASDDERVISAVSVLECRMALYGRMGAPAVAQFEYMIQAAGFEIAPFDSVQALRAFDAFLRFGRRSGHLARLNMGDCASYALAMSRGVPLLFKGNDFRHTDVTPAL
ncbi:MAG: type II toxin-antitoxin system VapC family toxin [Alphaproteobacteria bacterium]